MCTHSVYVVTSDLCRSLRERRQRRREPLVRVVQSSRSLLCTPSTTGDSGSELDAIACFEMAVSMYIFHRYCSHLPSEAINSAAQELLGELLRFQDRQFHRDPVKAKAKRRYVCGLREVKKHLELRKLKCVIVAPNLDRIQSPG